MDHTLMHQIGVASLRHPGYPPTWPNTASTTSAAMALGSELTVIRIPIGVFALLSLSFGHPIVGVLLFASFAAIDYVDGIAARRSDSDTATRRSLDVLVDRVFIHAAALWCALSFDQAGLAFFWLFLARDMSQGIYSASLILRHRIVVVGPKWHMSYGLTMLAWGSSYILTARLDPILTICATAVSLVTFVDYVRRSQTLAARLRDA